MLEAKHGIYRDCLGFYDLQNFDMDLRSTTGGGMIKAPPVNPWVYINWAFNMFENMFEKAQK